MTTHRKVAKKKHTHETAHGRAMANPNVWNLVRNLGRCWEAMGLLERGERLRELTVLGCSRRGLEKELKQSATSIRRHIALAELPQKDREAIEAGASAKKILERKASEHRDRLREERIIEDRKTGASSDEAATTILDFCRAKEGPRRVPAYGECAQQLLNETLWALYISDASGYRTVWTSKKQGVKGLFNKTRPPKVEDVLWMPHHAEWLANIVWAIAPERPIWESALQKAEYRIGELKPKKTLIERMEDRRRHLAWVTTSSGRPMDKGARSMARQGKPTQPSPPQAHFLRLREPFETQEAVGIQSMPLAMP